MNHIHGRYAAVTRVHLWLRHKYLGLKSSVFGNSNGNADSGSGTVQSHFEQCTMGNGSPQYRCLANSQSRKFIVNRLPALARDLLATW